MDYNQPLDNGPFPDAPFTWEQIARSLYKLLDDCDTADDIAKDADGLYRYLIRNAHEERFRYATVERDGHTVTFNVKTS